MRVLITGAAGRIGSVLSAGLEGSHDVRGLDLQAPERNFAAGFVEGDCADPDVAAGAVDGMDAVVHLAGIPTESDLPTILHGHVETTAALLDAMVQRGVGRMLYASSNHAVGMIPAHRAGPCRCATASRHVLRRREGGRRGTAQHVRRPLPHHRRRDADRQLPSCSADAAPSRHVAVARRLRADGPCRADSRCPRFLLSSTASRPMRMPGGTLLPVEPWDMSRPMTPHRSSARLRTGRRMRLSADTSAVTTCSARSTVVRSHRKGDAGPSS